MKRATINEQSAGQFYVEYDTTVGRKNEMRLDAETYDRALREARSFLSIDEENRDEAGDEWTVE
jgi:hypothetical protein